MNNKGEDEMNNDTIQLFAASMKEVYDNDSILRDVLTRAELD